jgi:ankyrin repeat protein
MLSRLLLIVVLILIVVENLSYSYMFQNNRLLYRKIVSSTSTSTSSSLLLSSYKLYRMSSTSGINSDGTLKKYDKPIPKTPASIAAFYNDITKLKTLSTTDLLSIEEESGNTPLIWCADQGHVDALQIILSIIEKEDPSFVNIRGFLGNTAISRASRGGFVDCVKTLLKSSSINPNISNEKMQYPLHFAAFKKKYEVVKVLLESKKCDTMVVDRKGRTPAEDTSDESIRSLILESRR